MLPTDMQLAPTYIAYTRPQLTTLDQVNVEKMLKKVPPLGATVIAVKLTAENARLVKLVKELREQRNLTPLKDDADFNHCWDGIEAALNTNNAQLSIRLMLRENMRLTAEIIQHQKALGLPLMPTKKV